MLREKNIMADNKIIVIKENQAWLRKTCIETIKMSNSWFGAEEVLFVPYLYISDVDWEFTADVVISNKDMLDVKTIEGEFCIEMTISQKGVPKITEMWVNFIPSKSTNNPHPADELLYDDV